MSADDSSPVILDSCKIEPYAATSRLSSFLVMKHVYISKELLLLLWDLLCCCWINICWSSKLADTCQKSHLKLLYWPKVWLVLPFSPLLSLSTVFWQGRTLSESISLSIVLYIWPTIICLQSFLRTQNATWWSKYAEIVVLPDVFF
jgi:hypothetical protein